MSTRANIIVRVPADKIGTVINFDSKKLHTIVGHGERINNVWTGVAHEEQERMPLTICNEYLSIYNHSDGYPESLGEILQAHYTDLDSVLNLMAGGNIGGIYEEYYNAWRDSKEWTQEFNPYQAEQHNSDPGLDEAFAYIWDNGKWYVRDWGYHHGNDRRPLLPVLKRLRKKAEQEADPCDLPF